jgi:hypothetical protein
LGLLGGRLPGSGPAEAERVGRAADHQQLHLTADHRWCGADFHLLDRQVPGQALGDRIGDQLGVAEHRLKDHKDGHHPHPRGRG